MREAFWNQYCPGCGEHYLLHLMRGRHDFIRELDLVAVTEGGIVGNSVCMPSTIRRDDGEETEVLTLGPIGVLPDCQGRGIGAALLSRTCENARQLGFMAILLCGYPDYYSRHGFRPARDWGIRTAANQFSAALQICVLSPLPAHELKGTYHENSVYGEVDALALERFDMSFPRKEKMADTLGQRKFESFLGQTIS